MSRVQPFLHPPNRTAGIGICVFLAAAVWFVFGQTRHFEFVNYDDDYHVYANASVTNGLTAQGLAWAFTPGRSDYWHPIDFVSHMVDCEFFGLRPGGHHVMNVILHASVSVLLFLVLWRITRALGASGTVALIFAVHPQRVESVAWISERKDVLHGLFFLLCLGAYVRYARLNWSWKRYLLVAFLFALGLMSKPTLMPLPLLLLLLDFWPLGRWRAIEGTDQLPTGIRCPPVSASRLLWEKAPLFVLSLVFVAQAVVGNRTAFLSNEVVPLSDRIANALTSYVISAAQMIWPANLAVLYPYPISGISVWEITICTVLLASITVAVIAVCRRAPYLFVGWFWYVIMIAPMIGFVQAGSYARADRYTYLPHIGLHVCVVFGLAELLRRRPEWRHIVYGTGAITVVALIAVARIQTAFWRNSEKLWIRALACTSSNAIAHQNLGAALVQEGRNEEAIMHFRAAIHINPYLAETHNNLGIVLSNLGQITNALACFERAIAIKPDYAEAFNNLGMGLAQLDRMADAQLYFQKAIHFKPEFVEAHYNRALALTSLGDFRESEREYREAIRNGGNFAEVHHNLAAILAKRGAIPDAILELEKAISIKPDYADAHYNLGILFSLENRLTDAVSHFQRAVEILPDFADARRRLAESLDRSRTPSNEARPDKSPDRVEKQ